MKRDFIIGYAHAYPSAESVFTRRNGVFACATRCCLLRGRSYPAIKSGYALYQITPNNIASKGVFAGYRFLLVGLILFLFALAQRKPVYRLSPQQFSQLALLGSMQTALQYTFF